MKKIKFSLLFILTIASLTFTSCSKDDDGPSNSDTYIKFTIDGTNYNFKDVITAESASITLNANNGEGISDTGDTRIAIWMPISYSEGIHDVSDAFTGKDAYKISFTSESIGLDFDFAKSGTITVIKKTSDYVEGAFTGTFINDSNVTKTISNGSFRAMTIN